MNVVSTLSVAITNKQAGILPAAVRGDLQRYRGQRYRQPGRDLDSESQQRGLLAHLRYSDLRDLDVGIYTPPATIPVSPNNSVTITATAMADTTKSDSNVLSITNSPLSACTQSRERSGVERQVCVPAAGRNRCRTSHMVGSFTADGTGHVTAGEIDANGTTPHNANLDTTATTYSVGADNRGCMTLKTASSADYCGSLRPGRIERERRRQGPPHPI